MTDSRGRSADNMRIGAPLSNRGYGEETHPKGRHEAIRKPAGNGMDVLHAIVCSRLESCKSVEEAVKLGITKELADIYFGTKEEITTVMTPIDRPRIKL